MKRVTRWVLPGLAATVLLVLIEFFGLFEGMNLYTYDLYFRVRGDRESSERIVIVAIDDKTLQKLGRWPIGRQWYAEILNRLGRPDVVGLDIILADPSPEDAPLARAFDQHRTVVLPTYLDPQRGWIRPNEILDHSPAGHIHLEQGIDGVVREVFHSISHRNIQMPSFAVVLRSMAKGEEEVSSLPSAPPLRASNGLEIIQSGPMRINYYGGRDAFRTVSFVDVLDGRWSPSFFDNRIVLVGRMAVGLEEGILTPLSQERKKLSGVEVHAHILNNLLDGTDIKPVGSWPLWISMLFTGLASFWWIERQNPLQMLLICVGGVILVNALSYGSLVLMYLWIPPAGFCGLIVAGCVAGYISRMRRMQALLMQAKKDWEESFDTLDEAIILYDRDCRIVRMNRAASQDLEPRFLAILRDRCLYWGRPNGPGTAELPSSDSWAVSPTGTEEVNVTHEGRHYEVRSLARVNVQGRFYGFIHVVREVTYRRQLELDQRDLQARLAQAQKMEALGTLAGGIAHDFNNILSAIIGYTELVSVSIAGTGKTQERLERIVQAGMRAKDLVNQILTFSRHTTHERKPIQPGLIVDEAMRLLRPALPTTIEILKDIRSEAFVEGDATQIHQIVMNLCTNAYQAMKVRGGVLKVEADDVLLSEGIERNGWALQPGGYVVIRVIDTGGGIPADIQKRIFEPYFTTKEKGEGTGLGLSTVHGILKAHGGGLILESEMGRGTAFHVYLPVLEGAVPSTEETASGRSLTGTERILFVDDEVALTEIASEALEELGYHVTASKDPSEALEAFRSHSSAFDLVITDMTMPKMTGVQLAREVRNLRADIPIILCTGYRQFVEAEDLQTAGIGSILTKPATSKDLARAIRRLMDQKKESDRQRTQHTQVPSPH